MNKKKLRFNGVDILLILILAAVIFVLLYIFVFSANKTDEAAPDYKTIRYVIEMNNIDSRFSDVIKAGDPVKDSVEKKNIGTVAGVQSSPYRKTAFDYENNRETQTTVEGKVTIRLTIEANAVDTASAYVVDNCEIRVGQQYSVTLPEMQGYGYCIFLDDK